MSEGDKFSPNALLRISNHADMVQRLATMVASELVVADGLSDADALMAMAQVFLACAAHTACAAARDHLCREPDAAKWQSSCDAAFQRAIRKDYDVESNVPKREDA